MSVTFGGKSYDPQPQADPERWLEEIEQNGVNLSAWEMDFVESVGLRVDADYPKGLTERQLEVLERIYTERVP